jgi:CubicO group peptidase (beta-lactamase class C family)
MMTKNQIGDVIVQTQHTTDPGMSRDFPIGAGRDKFGFGFQITTSNKENPDLRAPGSYTWAGIRNTHFWVDPRRQIAAVIMMQVLPFYDDACMKVYQDFEAAIGRSIK